jgi:hypothetical protein
MVSSRQRPEGSDVLGEWQALGLAAAEGSGQRCSLGSQPTPGVRSGTSSGMVESVVTLEKRCGKDWNTCRIDRHQLRYRKVGRKTRRQLQDASTPCRQPITCKSPGLARFRRAGLTNSTAKATHRVVPKSVSPESCREPVVHTAIGLASEFPTTCRPFPGSVAVAHGPNRSPVGVAVRRVVALTKPTKKRLW